MLASHHHSLWLQKQSPYISINANKVNMLQPFILFLYNSEPRQVSHKFV